MSEKKLVYFDHGRYNNFVKDIETIVSKGNNIITQWHKTQSWHTVETEADALELLTDPAGRLDAVISENVGMKAGKVKPDAQKLADLYNINRLGFLEYVTVKARFTINQLSANAKYIQWQGRAFVVNTEAVEGAKSKFAIYAESERQLLIYKHYETLRDLLALHAKLGFIAPGELQKVCETLNLAYANNRIYLNEMKLSQLINY